MRPIKYRAFYKGEMRQVTALEWIHEGEDLAGCYLTGIDKCMIVNEDETRFGVDLLAFTGLTDRNGTEIYNLDVVKLRDSYYLVVYRFGGYDLTCIDHNVWGSPYFYGCRNQLERVCSLYEYKGVIHIKPNVLEVLPELGVFNQNPGLLKGE